MKLIRQPNAKQIIKLIRNMDVIQFQSSETFSFPVIPLTYVCFWLTLWELAYNIFVPRFRPKTSSFRLPYQHHSSSAICARELFKGSNRLASLLVCTWKTFFGWRLRIFCEWRHKWSSFWAFLAHVAWPRTQLLGQSVSLKSLLEARLESQSFEPLIDFLAFLVQKLWYKINKLII